MAEPPKVDRQAFEDVVKGFAAPAPDEAERDTQGRQEASEDNTYAVRKLIAAPDLRKTSAKF